MDEITSVDDLDGMLPDEIVAVVRRERSRADGYALLVGAYRAAAESILWMAKKYAEAGGSGGPEMRDYEAAAVILAGETEAD